MPALAVVQAEAQIGNDFRSAAPRTPRQRGTARPIDFAYREIAAIGGRPESHVDEIRNELLIEVLDILERYGAVDPDIATPD